VSLLVLGEAAEEATRLWAPSAPGPRPTLSRFMNTSFQPTRYQRDARSTRIVGCGLARLRSRRYVKSTWSSRTGVPVSGRARRKARTIGKLSTETGQVHCATTRRPQRSEARSARRWREVRRMTGSYRSAGLEPAAAGHSARVAAGDHVAGGDGQRATRRP
jgi:hypothetical protein